MPLKIKTINPKAIYGGLQPMGHWLNWDPLQIFSSENDKRINFRPANRELPWERQPSAGRELAQSFTASIAQV